MKMYPSLAALLLACVLAFAPLTQAAQHLPININTATAEQIAEALDGVGEVRAAAIILLREQLGGFTNIEQLLDISGIGEATLKRIRPVIVLE
jgi:competence protein ComEA